MNLKYEIYLEYLSARYKLSEKIDEDNFNDDRYLEYINIIEDLGYSLTNSALENFSSNIYLDAVDEPIVIRGFRIRDIVTCNGLKQDSWITIEDINKVIDEEKKFK